MSGFHVEMNPCKLNVAGDMKVWSATCTGSDNQPIEELQKKSFLLQTMMQQSSSLCTSKDCKTNAVKMVDAHIDKYYECGIFPGTDNQPSNQFCRFQPQYSQDQAAQELLTHAGRIQCMSDDVNNNRAFVVPKDKSKLVPDFTSDSLVMGTGICQMIFKPEDFEIQKLQKKCINEKKGLWVFDGAVKQGGSCLTYAPLTEHPRLPDDAKEGMMKSDNFGHFSQIYDDATVYSKSLPVFYNM